LVSALALASSSATLLRFRTRPRSHKHCARDHNPGLGLCVGLGLGFGLGRVQPVRGPSMAVDTGCKDSRLHGTRPCTQAVIKRPCLWPMYTAVHDRIHRVHGLLARAVNTAVNTAMFTAVVGSRTRAVNMYRVDGRVYGPCTCIQAVNMAVFTAREHGRVPCTQPSTAHVHGRI